jgi:RimJ/RimL family protein N-acetyltransferase
MARPYWQRGIATEAVRALMQFGFDALHVHGFMQQSA